MAGKTCENPRLHSSHWVSKPMGQLGHGGVDMGFQCPGVHSTPNDPAFGEVPEAVVHPAHYGGGDNVYEVIKVLDAWDLGFSLGNAIKYIARAGKKDPRKTIEDLEKARFYLDHEITRLKERADGPSAG